MSLSHQTVLELMALADGELEGADKERAERLVAENDEARRIVETMRGAEVGSWVGQTMMERAAGADRIATAVMAKIGADGAFSLADRRARKSPRTQRAQVVVTAVTAGLALAAGIAAYVHSGASRPDERAPVASVGTPPVDFQAPSAVAQQGGAGPAGGVEVNEIDAPSRGVSVFEIPAAAAAAVASPSRGSSVVVWVDEGSAGVEVTTRTFLAALLSALLGMALVGVRGGTALASPPPPALELRVIHAMRSDGGASIDPRLRDLPQLTRDEPFIRYNVYKLLEQKELALEPDKPATSALVNGRTLQVTLVDVAEDAGSKRYHVRAEIGEPGKKAFLKLLEVTASPNEPFFVGGQSYEGGTLFLELVVRPR